MKKKLNEITKSNLITYAMVVIVCYIIVQLLFQVEPFPV